MSSEKQIQAVCKLLMDDGHRAHLDGRYQLAEKLYMLALTGLEASSELDALAQLFSLIGDLLAEQGRIADAEEWYRQALNIFDEHYPERIIDLAVIIKSLSEVCRAQSKFHEADRLRNRCNTLLRDARHQLERQLRRPAASRVGDVSGSAHNLGVRVAADAITLIGITLVAIWLGAVCIPAAQNSVCPCYFPIVCVTR